MWNDPFELLNWTNCQFNLIWFDGVCQFEDKSIDQIPLVIIFWPFKRVCILWKKNKFPQNPILPENIQVIPNITTYKKSLKLI